MTKTSNPQRLWLVTLNGARRIATGCKRHGRALIAALPLMWLASAVHADSDFIVTIKSRSGLCLDVNKHSTEKGANLIVYKCHGEDNQSFALEATDRDEEWFTAESVHSELCLDIKNESKAAGTELIQWPCHGKRNQRFDFRPSNSRGNVGEIRVNHSNLCLDAGADRSKTKVTQATCSGSAQQQWTINRI